MNKNILIINYNTQDFVDKLIMSINKFVNDANIIIFDNSDKSKFINTFENVHVIDNTTGDIINFEKELIKYPDRFSSTGKLNNWASAKHCMTIEKCIDLIDDNFILIDSDVLLKKDISDLFDNNYIFVGGIIAWGLCDRYIKRVAPWLCFINVKKIKENNIHYFDPEYMHGLHKTGERDAYDTGATFLRDSKSFEYKEINLDDYVIHYGHGSWKNDGSNKSSTKEEFFEKNKECWMNIENKKDRYDMIVVSLTSWTKRIGNCKTVIESLLNQNAMPDFIELNLSMDEFPNKESDLPNDLIDLISKNKIVEINWLEGNDGVFKKIIPTLKKFYGKEYYLLSVDDDWIYRSDYIELMIKYLNECKADTFCLAKANVIGNRQIYKSSCFEPDFWEKLTKDVINTRIDDMYIEYYLACKNKSFSCFRPNDTPDITKKYNQVFPNSHNTQTGEYSYSDIANASRIIKNIKFDKPSKKSRIAIFSCVMGGYDTPTDNFEMRDGYDYYLFLDNAIHTNCWNMLKPIFTNDNLSNVKKSKFVKTHPFAVLPDYDIAVWVDANTLIDNKLYDYIEQHKDKPITFKQHPYRDCIYEEIKTCCLMGKDTQPMCLNIFERYNREHFPRHYGLYENNIIIYHPKDPNVQAICNAWWNEIENFSHRDQLSLTYVLWKTNLKDFINVGYSENFPPRPHISKH